MSSSGNLVWDVNKRLIGYNEPNNIRTNYLSKNNSQLFALTITYRFQIIDEKDIRMSLPLPA